MNYNCLLLLCYTSRPCSFVVVVRVVVIDVVVVDTFVSSFLRYVNSLFVFLRSFFHSITPARDSILRNYC